MIAIEKVNVFGWEAAIRGLRNPLNSWNKSDSVFYTVDTVAVEDRYMIGEFKLGENDLTLMKTLSKAGSDHGKFLRMINVTVDITAPLYWWKEYDTYKIGTVANSCSTMHKIHAKEFALDDFSHEHLIGSCYGVNKYPFGIGDELLLDLSQDGDDSRCFSPMGMLAITVRMLNICRNAYLKTNDKKYWQQMIQLLPSSYNQKRTVQLNYQVLKAMYHARKTHKLDEWKEFCKWIEELPYAKELIMLEE